LAGPLKGQQVLDYGCGGGTYLALLLNSPNAPARAVGAEVSGQLIASNRARFGRRPDLEFVDVRSLRGPEFTGAFDALVCMEVLEHVLEPAACIAEFWRLLRPRGLLLVSVPVETGAAVVIKQTVRWINGWRRIGNYPGTTAYSWSELVRAVWAGSGARMERPVHVNADGSEFHDHKGFNWRWLREALRVRFDLESTHCSPVRWGPTFLASQVWFRARRRAE
jgi:SAM-dependent methyltransferase